MPIRSVERSDPMKIIRALTELPHRGATTAEEQRAADILAEHLEKLGVTVERQSFRTPKTYIWQVWWLAGGLVAGLLLIPLISWFALAIIALCAGLALLHFDWRVTPVSLLPPRSISENIIGRYSPSANSDLMPSQEHRKLILMGHYDSAPVSLLYHPALVKSFRQSLLISLGLMVLAVCVSLLEILEVGQPMMVWIRYLLAGYFLAQMFLTSIDYFRYGYTNGASDNATGAAVALATAVRLWRNPIPGWDVELVLTGAEEVGMVGARAYYRAYKESLDPGRTYVLNFDNMGRGNLKIITRTGSISNVIYNNPLVDAAQMIADTDIRFEEVKAGVWHTGDFDSIWFQRAGIPSLTLAAQDEQGLIPDLHRPTDIIDRVDVTLPPFAVNFAVATIWYLAESVLTPSSDGESAPRYENQ
jgi:hypothetical protein